MRVVVDTSVIASAFRSRRGASNALLQLVAQGKLRLLASPPLFLEYEDVLMRPDQRLAHGLSEIQVERALAALAALIEPVDIHFRWRPQTADPGDEMVLEAALNGRADALVTFNVRDFGRAASRFGLMIATPKEILERMNQ
jgi:putative PIN family toxin of toxin-antitoxin system